ncbi:MAG: YXWGXW repeat-containing protein [Candidatus Cybelea sp.]
MKILRSFPAIIAALLIAAVPLASPAQFSVGIGFTAGIPPPAIPYYAQPPAPYPNYQWTPGYWAWGQAGYYWVPGVWVAPPSVGLLWTPGYWGASGGGFGWNAGYWGASVGFYGGINYGFGYPGSGFYGGGWSGNNFRYNTAVTNVNRTVIHNTYNKTVVNNGNFCRNCHNVSYNGGKGGTTLTPTHGQIESRQNGRAPTTDQKNQANFAGQDRNQLATVNNGRPSLTSSNKPFSNTNRPANSKPITAQDKQVGQQKFQARNGNVSTPSNKTAAQHNTATQHNAATNKTNAASQNKPAHNNMNATNQNKPAHNNMNAANQNKAAGHQQRPQQHQPPAGQRPYGHQNMQGQQHYSGQAHQGGGQARPQGQGQGRPPGNGQGRPPRR